MTPHTCVIYNPAAGRGRAAWAVRRMRRRLAGVVFQPTREAGHATELARQAARDGFARVVAAGGDGTAHEVANGILTSDRSEVVFAAWPAGSMNDYAFVCGLGRWWHTARQRPLTVVFADVLRVTTDRCTCYSINGVGVGFGGLVTVESWRFHRLSGHALYTSAFLTAAALRYETPTAEVTLDGLTTVSPLLHLSVSIGQREGGFRLFPAARLDDGLADILRIGAVKRLELPRYLPGLLTGQLPFGHPEVNTGRTRMAAVRSDVGLCIHADGEVIRKPGGGKTTLSVELLPGRLRVEVCPTLMPYQ